MIGAREKLIAERLKIEGGITCSSGYGRADKKEWISLISKSMTRKLTFTWVDWKKRKSLVEKHPDIMKYHYLPHFEWSHIRPQHCVQDPVYYDEYCLWIFWGYHGIVLAYR